MVADRVPCVFYGADYSPEQWPESVWPEDMQFMRRAGVNLVTLGVFSWARLQPSPDQYTFDWLDRVVGLLHENGISINLATATASPPAWLGRLHPESLPQNGHGARYHHGSRQHFCPNSAAYRDHGAKLVRQLATRYGRHPAVVMWTVNNEYGNHLAACYCDACATKFREWLREKYGSLDALNEQWGTAFWSQWYHDWAEILPPRLTPACSNPGRQLDYHRFMSESLLGCFLNEKKVLKELAPHLPVTTNFSGPHGLLKSANYFAWAEHVDFVSFNSYPDPHHADPADIAFSLDLQRGLGRGRAWALLEQAPSQVNWRKYNAVKRPGQMRLWTYQALARGADALVFYPWRAPRAGAEKFHSAMLPHGGPDTRVHREVIQLGQELSRLGLVCGGRIAAEVALIVDWENYWALELDARPGPLDYSEIVRSYYRALFEPDVAIDIIQPEDDLARYKLVIAPALYLVRDGVAENLSTFVGNGGTVVMSFFSGVVDASDRVLDGGFPGPFRKLLGIHVEEMEAIEPTMSRHVRTAARSTKCSQWIDLIELEGAEVVAHFTEDFYAGRPAITRNAFGRGLAYYIGTQVEMEFLRRLLVDICEETGIRPPLKVPAGVEAVTRENEHGRFLFLLNHSTNPQFIELGGLEGTDLVTGQALTRQFQIEPRGVCVVHVG
ncbi:MAG: beta-galactosidase [Verrucomicrobia bacterium]|nr:beta-galactosidase [Verrucomicrobiota bacterium]